MTEDIPDRKLSPDEQEAIREQVRQTIRQADLTQRQAANESGIPYGTLTPWLGGTYAGDGSRIATAMQRWMISRGKRQEIRAAAPRNLFVETPSAAEYLQLLAHAQHMPDIVVIAGDPGLGKSAAACHYTRNNPNVFKIVAEEAHNSNRALLGELASVLGCYDNGSLYRISREIKQRLLNSGGLIIVDEAQHYTTQMLNQIRTYYDQCGVGIALIGNEAINARLRGGKRASEYAQLTRRVGPRVNRHKPRSGDITALLDAWEVPEGDVRKMLRAIALRPGALGEMQKTHRMAQLLANAQGRELTAGDVEAAYNRRNEMPLQVGAA